MTERDGRYKDPEAAARFPVWFNTELERRDWTQAAVAQKVGVGPGIVNGWAKGRSLPSHQSAVALARTWGLPPEDVLYQAGYVPEPSGGLREQIVGMLALLDDESLTQVASFVRWRVAISERK